MAGKLTFDELRAAVAAGEIDTVIAAEVDMQGRLMGKRFHAEYFLDSAYEETHSCDYLLTVDMEMEPVPGYKSASWDKGYGDYVLKPDLNTIRRLPWAEKTALVIGDILDHHTHQDVPISPRGILKKQIARLEAMGLTANAATELEFYVFRESFEDARDLGYRDLTTISAYNEDYHILQTAKEEHIMRALRNGLNGADVPVENTKGEADAGQAEVNVRYADALTMADRHTIVKLATKEIAWQQGHAVSFMAKWNYDMAGNSSHIHQSLWTKDGKSIFFDPAAQYGMSETMRHYLAGLLHHAEATTLFLAPNINSYKRFAAGTFAPTKIVWSMDNRTAGYRVCGESSKGVRVECRIGGADLNPYLALAGQIAAGIDGIENKLELEDEFRGDAYTTEGIRDIPRTLRDAAKAFSESQMMRKSLGDDVVDHYVHAAEWEQFEYDRRVTDWEVKRGFERS
ncbi:MAG: glutamine synthetase [Hyphomicrobiaceae bacterium]|nr:glutamine synthetase [Hyphomicrobiaceae bacterium]